MSSRDSDQRRLKRLGYTLSADEAWFVLLRDLLEEGSHCSAQNPAGDSLELVAYKSVVDMARPVVTHPGRKLGYKFQAAEAWWIMSGDDRVETIAPYSKAISQFSDDGVRFFGAYGPKVVAQLPYVVSELRRDPSSRRALLNIWRESPGPTRDYPCTLTLQFLLREGLLDCVATMRSSDVWLGWPYDVFNFSCVAAYVAMELGPDVGLGRLHLTAGSQHLYKRDFTAACALVQSPSPPLWPPTLDLVPLRAHLRGPDEFTRLLKVWADDRGSLEGLRRMNAGGPVVSWGPQVQPGRPDYVG